MILQKDIKKKKSYYILIGVSFIFIVVSLVTGIWYYHRLNDDNVSNTLKYNESIVKLMQNKIDTELNEVHYIEYYVEINDIIQNKLKGVGLNSQNKIDIMQMLNRLKDSMTILDDVYIFFEDENEIISSRNITSPEIYFETQCPMIGYSYENWRNEYLVRPRYREFYPISQIRLSDTMNQNVIIYKKTLYSSVKDVPTLHILMTIKLDEIEKLINDIDIDVDGKFLITDTHGDFIYKTGNDDFNFNTDSIFKNNEGTLSYNDNYIIYKKSNKLNLTYSVRLDKNVIFHKADSFMSIGILLIVLYLILVMGYLYISINTSYKPIKILMSKIGNDDFEQYNSSSEFNFITTKLDKLLEKENIYENQIERMDKYKKNRRVVDLLRGNPVSNEVEPLKWEYECFIVAIVRIVSFDEVKDENEMGIVKYAVLNMLQELFGKSEQCEIIESDSADIVAVFNFKESCRKEIIEDIKEKTEVVSQIVEDGMDGSIVVSVSGVHKGEKQVAQCYKEAKSSIDFRSLNDEENQNIIQYDAIIDTAYTDDSWYYWPTNLREALLAYVKRGDYDSVEKSIDELVRLNIKSPNNMDTLGECLYYNIFGILLDISKKYITSYSIINPPKYNKRMLFKENIRVLKEQFKELCDMMSVNNNRDLKLLNRIIEYIDEHFTEGSLSVTEIADNMQISTSYMQAYFKKHKNTTLIKYITQKRIEYAKQLLSDTSLTISSIAIKAGFTDPLYFGKIFKKNEGITPSKYRDTLSN